MSKTVKTVANLQNLGSFPQETYHDIEFLGKQGADYFSVDRLSSKEFL